ncbi:hypothetical protein [Streptomyces carpinensis]|uniref:Uncharacterized protein n=1 Tax=Streptomyces carpinensis TaxID=66369 RepID=A0ABV1W2G1_9ACTN|nr:hypothetical protein [Streptomyces carpinensis]
MRERLEAAAATDDARSTREQLVSFGVQAVPDGFEPRLAAG